MFSVVQRSHRHAHCQALSESINKNRRKGITTDPHNRIGQELIELKGKRHLKERRRIDDRLPRTRSKDSTRFVINIRNWTCLDGYLKYRARRASGKLEQTARANIFKPRCGTSADDGSTPFTAGTEEGERASSRGSKRSPRLMRHVKCKF